MKLWITYGCRTISMLLALLVGALEYICAQLGREPPYGTLIILLAGSLGWWLVPMIADTEGA